MTPKPRSWEGRRFGSLRVSSGFRAYVIDQLASIPDVTARSMFGGVGLYSGDLFFGIIARDVLYLKVDDATRARYEHAVMAPVTPYAHRPGTMQYYEVPAGVLESAAELERWAGEAVAAARRAFERHQSRR
jgi:DNA transformation protein